MEYHVRCQFSGCDYIDVQLCFAINKYAVYFSVLIKNKNKNIPLKSMKLKTERTSIMNDQRLNMKSSEKALKASKKANDMLRSEVPNISSCSIGNSHLKNYSITENEAANTKPEEAEFLQMAYFTEKYLMRDDKDDNLKEQMKATLSRRRSEIQSLRIYRDELKFISRNNQYNQPIKLSVQTLKQKAEIQERLVECKSTLQKQIRNAERQMQTLAEYQRFLQGAIEGSTNNPNNYLDITKQEQVMLKNLELQKDMLVRELAEEQRKNAKEIKAIQEEILEYRIMIKDKEDTLRNLKSKLCTLYIKLHSRNSSRTGSKSKDRNMSLSIRKFNNMNHSSIKEAYIGSNTFKSYAKETIEKVTSEQQLIKIKFFMASSGQADPKNKNQQQLFFQCFYRGRDGQVHDERNQEPTNDDDATRDKISSASTQKYEQVYVKHLFSMKFFYKAKIVGVQCRIKTDKGNKHIYIGNCDPHIEHQLLTLVNKKIVTLGSYWHGKQMIGISVWYSERNKMPKAEPGKKSLNEEREKKQQQAYDEYYT